MWTSWGVVPGVSPWASGCRLGVWARRSLRAGVACAARFSPERVSKNLSPPWGDCGAANAVGTAALLGDVGERAWLAGDVRQKAASKVLNNLPGELFYLIQSPPAFWWYTNWSCCTSVRRCAVRSIGGGHSGRPQPASTSAVQSQNRRRTSHHDRYVAGRWNGSHGVAKLVSAQSIRPPRPLAWIAHDDGRSESAA